MKQKFHVEYTDTFSGEANYSWVKRATVDASSVTGAIRKVRKDWGHTGRIVKAWDSGDTVRYNVSGACVCYFVSATQD